MTHTPRPIEDILADADRLVLCGEVNRAREALRRARMLTREQGPADAELGILARLGELELASSFYGAARETLSEALALPWDDTRITDRAYALYMMGALEDAESNTTERDALWNQAKALLHDAGDTAGEARILRVQAGVARRARKDKRALALYGQALGLYTALGHTFHRGMVLRERGLLHRQMERPDLAHNDFETAIELFAMNGNTLDEAQTHFDLGEMLASLGNLNDGREAMLRALRAFSSAGDRKGEARALIKLGNFYRDSAPKLACKYYARCADLAGRLGLAKLEDAALVHQAELEQAARQNAAAAAVAAAAAAQGPSPAPGPG